MSLNHVHRSDHYYIVTTVYPSLGPLPTYSLQKIISLVLKLFFLFVQKISDNIGRN